MGFIYTEIGVSSTYGMRMDFENSAAKVLQCTFTL